MQFDLRNGSIRKKYDSLKYTLRKLENTLYELSLAEAGYKRQEDADKVRPGAPLEAAHDSATQGHAEVPGSGLQCEDNGTRLTPCCSCSASLCAPHTRGSPLASSDASRPDVS